MESNIPPLIQLSFGAEWGEKWRPMRALLSGLKPGGTIRLRLPEGHRIIENCRCEIAMFPLRSTPMLPNRYKTKVDKISPFVLWVTRKY